MCKRIAVISYGLVSALGNDAETSWENLLKKKTGLKKLPIHISNLVRSESAYLIDYPYIKDRLLSIAIKAVDESLNKIGNIDIDFISIGSSSAGFSEIERKVLSNLSIEVEYLKPRSLVRRLAQHYSIDPKRTIQCSQACASSAYAIAIGADMIRLGHADVVLAGGADEVTASVIAGFESIRIHAKVCRPFDEVRTGLVLGEAAAFIVLCSETYALKHGLPILAYLNGIGLTCDAYHMSTPDPSGQYIIRAINKSLSYNKSIDLICTHGTGTKHNDSTEALVLNTVFGKKVPPITSYKGSFGHPQGTSGACGIVVSTLALEYNTMFPTTGLKNQDKTFHLDIVKERRIYKMNRILCLSYGSWGANSSLVLSRN